MPNRSYIFDDVDREIRRRRAKEIDWSVDEDPHAEVERLKTHHKVTETGITAVKKKKPEDEWERVKRMRREGHSLIEGGNSQKRRGIETNPFDLTFKGNVGLPNHNKKRKPRQKEFEG